MVQCVDNMHELYCYQAQQRAVVVVLLKIPASEAPTFSALIKDISDVETVGVRTLSFCVCVMRQGSFTYRTN